RTAKTLRNFLQRALNRHLNFVCRELLKRRATKISNLNTHLPFRRLRIDRNVFLQMPLEPALLIQRFANSDTVEPRFQRATLTELANPPKSFQENFLHAVDGIRNISEHGKDQVINRSI